MKAITIGSHDDTYLNPDFAWPEETSVAFAMRLRFIAEQLRSIDARSVLDIGCGTGEQLTAWLAQLCPRCRFQGVDSDRGSIEYAREQFQAVANIGFALEAPADGQYDAVIASEVLEHVDDPFAFLAFMRSRLRENGLLIITTPNGYGCSEWMSLFETLLVVSGAWDLLRGLKQTVLGPSRSPSAAGGDTRAVSPHVNFFGLRRLRRIFRDCNLQIVAYQGRMFLHNFLCTMLIDRSRFLSRVNTRLGSKLPAWLVSDWMFALTVNGPPAPAKVYRRNVYESVKRYLNLKRFGLRC